MRMGGELTLDSELGKGSTFTVTLQKVGFSSTKPVEADDEREQFAALPDKRVMVVDDMSVNRLVMQAMLKRMGITDITTAANGVEALKALNDAPDAFDVILTDMLMPVMDGKDLIREIRKIARWKELRVYAVTADAEAEGTIKRFEHTGEVQFRTLPGIPVVKGRLEDFTGLFKIPDVPTSLCRPEPENPRRRARKK